MKINYRIDPTTGLTYSSIGTAVAVPVKDRRNKFGTWDYKLLLFHLSGLGPREWINLRPVDNLPVSVQHYHKQFWAGQKTNQRKEMQ